MATRPRRQSGTNSQPASARPRTRTATRRSARNVLAKKKRKAFVEHYLVHFNGAQAARDAGFAGESAKQTAHKLLQEPAVQKAIAEGMATRFERLSLTADRAMIELGALALSNIDDYDFDDDGFPIVCADASPLAMRAVKKIKRKRRIISQGKDEEPIIEVETELELHSKDAQLTNLLKHHKLVGDKVEHEAGKGLLEALVGMSMQEKPA